MGTYICRDCEKPVNRAEAHIRSVNFEQVAYCPDCWSRRRTEASVPEPRLSPDLVPDPAAH
jgi:DNA-directed RNA polymerase subunit RPC12/RpoP